MSNFFCIDNITTYACFTKNTLLAKKINLDVGKKQLQIRNRFYNVI